ncbi:MAG: hypothetical protein DRI57_22490 [Deltaproteobacteria bacterium]|nr:MAG: hypothetical protein DRI57_22490 [Deltaproteobacteria bacterium]
MNHGLPLITQISLIFFNPCNQRNPCESVVRSMKSLNHGLPLITQISLIFSIRAIRVICIICGSEHGEFEPQISTDFSDFTDLKNLCNPCNPYNLRFRTATINP